MAGSTLGSDRRDKRFAEWAKEKPLRNQSSSGSFFTTLSLHSLKEQALQPPLPLTEPSGSPEISTKKMQGIWVTERIAEKDHEKP
jgi:hypothetical protein